MQVGFYHLGDGTSDGSVSRADKMQPELDKAKMTSSTAVYESETTLNAIFPENSLVL
jgi:hypothetical protein